MAGIGCLKGMAGAIPKTQSYLLEPHYATYAENCLLHGGRLAPEPLPAQANTVNALITAPRSIFKLDDRWFAWNSEVDALRAQIGTSDPKVYYTGDEYPKYTRASFCAVAEDAPAATPVGRRLGVVPPDESAVLTIEKLPTNPDSDEIEETTSYVYTLVTDEGFESAPCPASALVDLLQGQYVRLSGFKVPDPLVTNNLITHYRIYRLITGSTGESEYYHVKVRPGTLTADPVWDVDITQITPGSPYVYDADHPTQPTGPGIDIGSMLSTGDFLQPPDNLKGLVQLENGVLAGFAGPRVYLSMLNYHYAFPLVTQYDMDHPVVALGVYKSALIVMTEGSPYVLYGPDPLSITKTKWPEKRACVSAKGVIEIATGVVFPCEDGLYYMDGSVGKLLTDGLLTRDQWQALGPENFVAFLWDGHYVAINTTTSKGIKINLEHLLMGVSYVELDAGTIYLNTAIDYTTGEVYLLTDDGTIVKWAATTTGAEYQWEKLFRYAGARNFSCAKIVGDFADGTKSCTITALDSSGTQLWSIERTAEGSFRLPGGFRTHEMTLRLTGDATIDRFAVAESMLELQNV